MKNLNAIANLFAEAQSAQQVIEEKNLQDNIFEVIVDLKENFRAEINASANIIRFIQYKKPNEQKACELQAQIDSLKQEYNQLISKISFRDEQAVLMNREIKRLEYMCKQALASERYSGWYLKPTKSEFTEADLQTIASVIFAPWRKTSLYSVLYRMWAVIVIDGEYKQADPETIPACINLNCEGRVENALANQLSSEKSQQAKLEREASHDSFDSSDDSYIDLFDNEWTSL